MLSTLSNGGERTGASAPVLINQLSNSVRQLSKASGVQERANILAEMQSQAKALHAVLSESGFEILTTFTSALSKLFNPLSNDLERINASLLRTTSHGIDFLNQYLSKLSDGNSLSKAPLRILILDDDAICRTTLQLALQNPQLTLTACDAPEKALAWLQKESCDLIFSDIMMPKTDGLALAKEIRKLPNHSTTPIIFITVLSDFATRSKSVMNGGCDLIAKPFINSEVLVKAFTTGLKYRLTSPSAAPANSPAPSVPSAESSSPIRLASAPSVSPEVKSEPKPTPSPAQAEPTGFICLDGEGRVKSINKVCGEILGYGISDVVGWHISRLVPEEIQPSESPKTIAQMLNGEQTNWQEIEIVARCQNGTALKAKLTIMGAHSQGKRQFIGLIRPIAQQAAIAPSVPAPAVEAPVILPTNDLPMPTTPLRISTNGNGSERPVPPSRNVSLLGPSVKEPKLVLTSETEPPSPAVDESEETNDAPLELSQKDDPATETIETRPISLSIPEPETTQSEEAEDVELDKLLSEAEALREKLAEEAAAQMSEEADVPVAPAQSKIEDDKPASISMVVENQVAPEEPSEPSSLPAEAETEITPKALTVHFAEPPSELLSKTDAPETNSEPQIMASKPPQIQPVTPEIQTVEAVQDTAQTLRLEARIKELELAKADLSRQSEAASQRNKLWQQSIQSLEVELAEARELRDKELQEQAERESKLKEECSALELQAQTLEETLARTRAALKDETARKGLSEQKASDLAAAQASLARELAERKRSEDQWQREAREKQERLHLQTENLAIEQRKLAAKVQELETAEAAIAEITNGNAKLQQELASSNEAVNSLRRQVEELEAAQESISEKLATSRTQLKAEISHRQRLEAAVKRLEHSKAELTRQLEAASERYKLWQDTIQSLQSELEQTREQREKEVQERAQQEAGYKDQIATLENEAQTLERSYTEAQSQLNEESTKRTLAEQKATELTSVRISLEHELVERKRASEQKQRELEERQEHFRAQTERLAAEQQKLESKVKDLQAREVRHTRESKMELAGLRYQILEGVRMNSQIGEHAGDEHLQMINRLVHLTSSMLNTPLSKVQRHLANAIRKSLETLSSESLDGPQSNRLSFEAFTAQHCEFVPEEVNNNALRVIRTAATEAGVDVQASTSGAMTRTFYGDSAHLYQLMTLLGSSLCRFTETKRLEVKFSVAQVPDQELAEATVQILVHTKSSAAELGQRCADVASGSATLQIDEFADAEAGLAAAWQLASALGGIAKFDIAAEKQLRLTVSLSLPTNSKSSFEVSSREESMSVA